jgi:hypothetical protein
MGLNAGKHRCEPGFGWEFIIIDETNKSAARGAHARISDM